MKTVGILRSFTLTFLTIAVALLFLMRASPAAAAANCLQDEFGSKKLNCTANDVTVSFVDNVRDLNGHALPSCTPNSHFSFVADFHVVTTATSRQNIGIYFQTAGGSTALKGTCSDNIISPLHAAANPLDTVQLGSATYNEVDPSPDNCGDTTSAHPEVVTIEVDNVLCVAAAGSNPPVVALPNCTSWQQNSGIVCQSDPSSGWPWVKGALPGTVSKCSCDNGFTVPIAVQSPSTTVKKSCTTANSTGLNTSCSLDDTGSPGTVTYTVEVDNTSNFGNLTLNRVCDNVFGTIAKATGQPDCAPGTATATPVSCTLPATIAAGGNFQCTFTASQPEGSIVMDIASANGVGVDGTPFSGTSNSVTVTSAEAASTATTSKTLVSTTAGCATVRYGVDVHNTSAADEVLTLSALSDSQYGNITTLGKGSGGSVLGTTCGVATGSPGLGSLSGSTGGGTLSTTIAIDGHYTCQFDAQFCGALTTITTGPNTTCTGIQTTDVVTPTLAGDEGEAVSNTGGSLTVSECFVPSAQ